MLELKTQQQHIDIEYVFFFLCYAYWSFFPIHTLLRSLFISINWVHVQCVCLRSSTQKYIERQRYIVYIIVRTAATAAAAAATAAAANERKGRERESGNIKQ